MGKFSQTEYRRAAGEQEHQMSSYIKAMIAVMGGIGTWGVTAAQEGIATDEWFGLLVALSTALGVFAFPNQPQNDDGHYDVAGVIVMTACAIVVWLVLYAVIIK